jgi:hypothetical protein
MELWLWIFALVLSLAVLVIAAAFLAAKAISLLKRLKPFSLVIAQLRSSIEHNSEAVKFFSGQIAADSDPNDQPRPVKGRRK